MTELASDLTPEQLQQLVDNLHLCSPEEQTMVATLISNLHQSHYIERCRTDLLTFCQHMQPDYQVGRHHKILANKLMNVEKGIEDRVCVNIPPRHGKSLLTSTYFPAWYIGRNPNKKLLMVSHTTDLAVDFGRKVRNLIDSPEYQQIFPNVKLAKDSKSADRKSTRLNSSHVALSRMPSSA